MFDLSLDMMTATTLDGYVVVANPRFETTLGWTDQELRSKNIMEFVHPEDQEMTAAEFAQLNQGMVTMNFQCRVRCKDGSYKLLSWHAVPSLERGIMYCTARDVTDDEQLFRTFAEHNNQVIWMEDPVAHRTVYVSPAYEQIWDRPCSSLYTNPQGWFDAIHPDDKERVESEREAQQHTGIFNAEYRIVRPDGSVRWIRARGFPIRTATGRITRLAGMAEDVSDRHNLETHLRHNERLATIGTFAAGVAHEINNPLGAILLAAESALKRLDERSVIELAFQDVLVGTERCGRIVDNILKFSREESLEKHPAELNSLVDHAANLFARRAAEHSAVVGFELAADLPSLLLNETEVEQAIYNLLENACNAGARQITVRTEQLAEGVSLAVDDDGAGIAEADMPHLFEPFFTTRRGRGGSGLGLSITHGIVADHGGTISIEPRAGGGTSVCIQFAATRANTHKEPYDG